MTHATILMDPPWPETGGGKIKRGCDRHYPVIKRREDIARVVLQSGVWDPADDAHLYVWVTNNYLPWGLWLMDALGFRYITNLPWTKDRIGLGQYFRGGHELLLFGVRGSGPSIRTDRRDISTTALMGAESVFELGRVVHSAKPVEAYELIEARSKGPYLEIFARNTRDGWTSWGNEIE